MINTGIIFKNIKNSIIGYKQIYITMIVSQIIAVMLLFFAYGLFGSFDLSKEEFDDENKKLYAHMLNRDVKLSKFWSAIFNTIEDTDAKISDINIIMMSFTGEEEILPDLINILCGYEDGRFYIPEIMYERFPISEGRYFTEDEFNNGELVTVAVVDQRNPNKYKLGEYVEIKGTKYKIVGIVRNHDSRLIIPPMSNTDNLCPKLVVMDLYNYVTVEQHEYFTKEIEKVTGDRGEVREVEFVEIDKIIAMNSLIVISAIIGIMAALDTALLYHYIMDKRREQMTIIGIVGAKGIHKILINEAEILLITLITSAIGFVIFRYGIENIINKIYENIVEVYHTKSYLLMWGIYVGTVFVITLILSIIQTHDKKYKKCVGE